MGNVQNPKMVDSNLIDCVPQAGPCPNDCKPLCFYQKWFYAGHDPVMPSLEEAENKIVRVNSGNDSNNHRNYVLEATAPYPEKFYNTSIPDLDFDGHPVMLTVNGTYTDSAFWAVEDVTNLMAVRFRANTWNVGMMHHALQHYTKKHVPVILTFMRYYTLEDVKRPEDYERRRHVTHEYWDITQDAWRRVMTFVPLMLASSCGTPKSAYCRDCGNCEHTYRVWKASQGATKKVVA